MDNFVNLYSFLIGFAIFYGVIIFFDTIFKTCMFYPYLSLMEQLGVTIKPYIFIWSITRFNRAFFNMGNFLPRFLKKWFNIGYYCTFLTIFISVGFLLMPIIQYIAFKMPIKNAEKPVVSVLPGITTPFYHIVYIIPALTISMIFHEFGHAIAASREKVPVDSCGISLLLIFPIAFVNLSQLKLNLCTHQQQLRVYCAGVWHNIVLVVFGLLVVHYGPSVLYPGLRTGSGVTVIDVKMKSSLAHHGGFLPHDIVTSINDCNIKSEEDWYNCLAEIESSPQLGFCSSEEFVQTYGDVSTCCTNSSEHLCFEFRNNKINQYACIFARKFIDKASFCKNNSNCIDQKCLIPYLPTKGEKLIKFQRENQKSVLFIGYIEELYYNVKVSSWISHISFLSVNFVIHVENFFKYLAGISAGLVIMNVVPSYFLDGGYIIENIIELHFKSVWRRTYRNIVVDRLKAIGFILLVINIVKGISDL